MNESGLRFERIAKIGGSSMAQPEVAFRNLTYQGNEADIIVVSAPGINEELGHVEKLTDRLISLRGNINCTKADVDAIQAQLGDIATLCDPDNKSAEIGRVVDDVPKDIDSWQSEENPIEVLGEYWAAKILASYTDREFIDARHIIRFDQQGNLSLEDTFESVQRELGSGGRYVIPGFYGSDNQGRIRVMGRGASDTSGAILSEILGADTYDIWSDVPGFMTANPKVVPEAHLVKEITRREAREMYIGCELLHRDVLRFAGRTAIRLRNTFGKPDEVGTIILEHRDSSVNPIVGIVGTDRLLNLNLHEFGMNERAGMTNDVFEILTKYGIPYEHTATSTDDLSIIFSEAYREKLSHILRRLNQGSRQVSINPIGAVRIVGEPLREPDSKRATIVGRGILALASVCMDVSGFSGAPDTVSRTLFLHNPADVAPALNALHQELIENQLL